MNGQKAFMSGTHRTAGASRALTPIRQAQGEGQRHARHQARQRAQGAAEGSRLNVARLHSRHSMARLPRTTIIVRDATSLPSLLFARRSSGTRETSPWLSGIMCIALYYKSGFDAVSRRLFAPSRCEAPEKRPRALLSCALRRRAPLSWRAQVPRGPGRCVGGAGGGRACPC